MNEIVLKIQVMYNEMGKAEKRIADWILKNSDALLPLSIIELAEKCKCGEATIVRFSKRLGLSGYQELKISIARERGRKNISEDILVSDSCFDILEKVSNEIYCSIESTKKNINKDDLQKAAELLLKGQSIVFFGLGNSSSVAQDAAHKLLRAGKKAIAYSDNHMQTIAAAHLNKGDVAVGISHSGSSKDIIEALKIAKEQGAKTVCITNKGKSPILKYSDITIFTSSPETNYTILGLNSRIAALSVIDAIYSYIICHDNQALSATEKTEAALQNKKY